MRGLAEDSAQGQRGAAWGRVRRVRRVRCVRWRARVAWRGGAGGAGGVARTGHDILEELRTLLGGGPRAERLTDREDVVVDRLRQADHAHRVALLLKEGGEVGGRRVRVVAADGVQNLHLVLDQLVRRDALRVLPILDEAALDAILHVGQLHTRVADRRAAVELESPGRGADLRRHRDRVAHEKALIAVDVADDLGRRVLVGVLSDQATHRRRQARGKAAGGEEGHLVRCVLVSHGDACARRGARECVVKHRQGNVCLDVCGPLGGAGAGAWLSCLASWLPAECSCRP